MNALDSHINQAVMNTFVLIMFHMAKGHTISRRIHILHITQHLQLIANDASVSYVTIIPIRPGLNAFPKNEADPAGLSDLILT